MARAFFRLSFACSRATLISVEKRNLTLSLPVDLIRQAKIYAAEHDTSVNTLVLDLLRQAVSRDDRVERAVARLLELADAGPYSSVDPGSIRREDLYDRI
jgi:plasmid stability protein